jgi:hypothetical protein
MALALLKLPLSVLALLVVGLPVLLAVVGLLLVRSRVPHPRFQPHHDVAGYGADGDDDTAAPGHFDHGSSLCRQLSRDI